MENKVILPESCEKCNSKRIKVSQHYSDYYFCKDCKDGGPLMTEKERASDKLLREFEQMLNDNY